jgi:hypothetical protein
MEKLAAFLESQRAGADIALASDKEISISFPDPSLRFSAKQLADLNSLYEANLPADYGELMMQFGPLSLEATDLQLDELDILYFFEADSMLRQAYIPVSSGKIGGLARVFGFATDGSGSQYFLDLDGRLGKGSGAVFVVDTGECTASGSVYLADSITDLLLKYLGLS